MEMFKIIIEKLSAFIGGIIGVMLSEHALALAIFAGRPEWALIWAMARAVK